jgi:hypothetical protein
VQRSVADGLVYGDSAVGQIVGERVEGVYYSNFTKSTPAFGDHPDSLFDGPSDGDKWDVFSGADQGHAGDIVTPASAGFPNVGNVLSVHPTSAAPGGILRLIRDLPEVTGAEGEHLYLRWMFRHDGGDWGDDSQHPIEAGNNGTIPWAFRTRTAGGTPVVSAGMFRYEWVFSGWSSQYFFSPEIPWQEDEPRYYELHIEFLGSDLANVDCRVRDADGVQIMDASDWLLSSNPSQSMADVGQTGVVVVPANANLPRIQIGINGIGGTDWHPTFQYAHEACIAVSQENWCGIHGTIYTAADPVGEVVGAGG